MNAPASLPPAYFDAVYAAHADPWNFEGSAYERDKYAVTMARLPARRFAEGFEIGCSIGVLTRLLADRCDRLLAVDVSEVPLSSARHRLAGRSNVRFEKMAVPAEFPAQRFDLVMLSEVGYYWSPDDPTTAARRIVGALETGGSLMLVHWTPPVHDYPLTGDQVHETFLSLAGPGQPLLHCDGGREATYRLDLFQRNPDPD